MLVFFHVEYIWNFYFYQDGNVEVEIRLTGVLQVYVAGPDEPTPHGTTVAPGINAHYHQHIFSLRIDPMLDGLQNSVIESEVVGIDHPKGSAENFAGNGFVIKDRVLKSQVEDGARDFEWATERRWRIANLNRTHYSSGKPSSYQIVMKGGAVPLLAKQDSWIAQRASFAHKQLWVVKDEEGPRGSRLFPSGKYVSQTRAEPKDSVGKWVKEGQGSIENEDILLFLTLGGTFLLSHYLWACVDLHFQGRHISPVQKTGLCTSVDPRYLFKSEPLLHSMPVEHVNVLFKPSSFFIQNPALDVPGTQDPQSRPAFANGTSACCRN